MGFPQDLIPLLETQEKLNSDQNELASVMHTPEHRQHQLELDESNAELRGLNAGLFWVVYHPQSLSANSFCL